MRKFALILTAAAVVGFGLPVVTSAQAEDAVVVKERGEHRDHDRHWDRDRHHHHVVIITHRRHRDHDHD